ncbi:MAG: cohesin domain-containing protein, partial [Ruminococcus sp.]|nr:cohesin domain-containing protein [Ruminococcus sp.]
AIIVKVPTTTSTVTTSTVTTTSEGSTTTTTSGSTTSTTSGSTTTTTSASTTTTTSGSTTTTTSGSTTSTTSGSTSTTTSGSTTSTTSGSTTTTTSGSTTSTTSGSTTTTTSGSTTSTTSSSTSTTSTTSSSTTTTTIPANAVIWQVESVTAKQGDTVKVPVKLIDINNSKLPVSGAQFTIDFDTDNFELVGASDKSGAYLADIVYNPATGQYAFANGTGNAVIGTDGSDVIVLEFKVKDTCPNGKYDIAIEDLFVSDANGGDITALVVTVPGKITVDGSGTGPWTADTFAIVEKTHGFYFSHDNGTRNNGEKGGFNPGQITNLKIYDRVTQDGITVDSEWAAENVDMSEINFGGAVPSTVYDEDNTSFKYEVPVYYGKTPMVDRDGNQITVTVYIGVKGDIDLNNKVLANDAAQVLAFYTASQDIGADPAKIQLSESPYVTGADDVLDDFCAFLGDVDVNEWSEDNWKLTKADRKILANDAGAILTFYSESQTPGAEAQALWDEIVPERYGEIA